MTIVHKKAKQKGASEADAWIFVLSWPSEGFNEAKQFFKCPLVKWSPVLAIECATDEEMRRKGTGAFPKFGDMNTQFELPDCVRTLFAQLEQGAKESRVHIQCYIEFKEKVKFVDLISGKYKNIFGEGKEGHFHSADGGRKHNKDYCSKPATRGGRPNGTTNLCLGDTEGERQSYDPEKAKQRKRKRKEDEKRGEGESDDRPKMFEESTTETTVSAEIEMPNADGSIRLVKVVERKKKESLLPELRDKEIDALLTEASRLGKNAADCVYKVSKELNQIRELPEEERQQKKSRVEILLSVKHNLMMRMMQHNQVITAMAMADRDEKARAGAVRQREVYVAVFTGPPGTGKTFEATTRYAQTLGAAYVKDAKNKFWTNYCGQRVVVIDEFEGDGIYCREPVFSTQYLLRVLDGYDMTVGGKMEKEVNANWVVVILTSNMEFDQWFGGWSGISEATKEAIKSRINKFEVFQGENLRTEVKAKQVEPTRSTNIKISLDKWSS